MSVVLSAVLSGTLVFVLGQIMQKYIFKPISDYMKAKSRVGAVLRFYSNIITDSNTPPSQAIKEVRKLAVGIEVAYLAVPFAVCVGRGSYFKNFATADEHRQAIEKLYYLSNALGKAGCNNKNSEEISEVYKLLRIKKLAA